MQEQALAAGGAGLLAGGAFSSAGGNRQGAGVAGAAAYQGGMVQQAGVGMGGVAAGILGRAPVGAGLVPVSGTAGTGRRRRILLVALLSMLVLALVGSGLLVFASSQTSATVTLTLQSRLIQNTYLVTATTATTSQGQVQATVLTQTVVQSKTAHASGYFPGFQASGFLTFQNTSTICGCPIFIPAGSSFTSSTGVTVVTNSGISVAAQCVVTVAAHATIYGSGGDIPAGSIHATFGAHIQGTNRLAFTGGQSGKSNALVQQGDINGLTSALQAQNEQDAHSRLQTGLQSGQRLAGAPLCHSKAAADHPVGSVAMSVMVTVTTTCTAEAYDFSGMLQIVGQKVQVQAASYFSSDFVEVGALQAAVTNTTLTDARSGTLLLAVQATGKWAYRFNQNLKRSLAKVIAGKDVSQVRALLSSEAGIAAVSITISGSNHNTLPTDDTRIAIVLKA